MDEILSTLFSVALASFLIRWGVNWVLLNKINNTDYFSFGKFYSLKHCFPILKHAAISEWKFWWKGSDHANLKRVSNILSVVVYSSVSMVIAILVFIYNR
jgi:hypothetical protein